MKRLYKLLIIGVAAAFLAVVAMPVSSGFAQEKDAMSKSGSSSANKMAEKSKTELAQLSAKIKAYTAKLNDPKVSAKDKAKYRKTLKKLKDYKKLVVATMENAKKCKDDSCYDQQLAVLDKIGNAADKVSDAPEAAGGVEPATTQQQDAVAAATTDEGKTEKSADALQTTVADATSASSMQSGGRIGGIDTEGAPPADPNATDASPTTAASTTGEGATENNTVIVESPQ